MQVVLQPCTSVLVEPASGPSVPCFSLCDPPDPSFAPNLLGEGIFLFPIDSACQRRCVRLFTAEGEASSVRGSLMCRQGPQTPGQALQARVRWNGPPRGGMGKRKSPSRMEWESGVGPLGCLVKKCGREEAERPRAPLFQHAAHPPPIAPLKRLPVHHSEHAETADCPPEPVSHHVMWWCTSVLAGVWLDDCLEASPDRCVRVKQPAIEWGLFFQPWRCQKTNSNSCMF